MKTIKTEELTGAALDWAVASLECDKGWLARHMHLLPTMPFSSDWAQGGPIIEREGIDINRLFSGGGCEGSFALPTEWTARRHTYGGPINPAHFKGHTPLVAAMRCYVASKLGDEVEIPEGLL